MITKKRGDMMTIGEKIKDARKKAGLTQEQLAEKLEVSQVMVAQYENNVRNPKLETLKKISNALEVDLFDIIVLEEPREISIVTPEEDELRTEVKSLTYSLNKKGLTKTRDYMRDLMEVDKYKMK